MGQGWGRGQFAGYELELLSHAEDEPDGLGLILAQLYDLEQILIAKVEIQRRLGQLIGVLDPFLPAPYKGRRLIVPQN